VVTGSLWAFRQDFLPWPAPEPRGFAIFSYADLLARLNI